MGKSNKPYRGKLAWQPETGLGIAQNPTMTRHDFLKGLQEVVWVISRANQAEDATGTGFQQF